MAIHELQPRFKIGPIKIRSKLGERVDQVKGGILVDEKQWDFGKGSYTVDDKDGPIIDMIGRRYRREPIWWWDNSGHFVTVRDSSTVTHTIWADNDVYGYVQTDLGELRGEQINEHPVVGRKLRYIPD